MEDLNLEGFFWLDAMPDDKVAGRLTFDAVNGADLDLFGSFHSLQKMFDEVEHPVRIHGIAEKKLLTLVDCWRVSSSIQSPGFARERYRPTMVLSGGHLNESKPLVFDGVRLKLHHLDDWVWKTGTVIDFDTDERGTGIESIHVTHNPLDKEFTSIDIGELELIFSYDFKPDPFHTTTLTQSALFGVRFDESRTMQGIFDIYAALRNLVTIGVGAPAFVTEASLVCSDLTRELPSGKEFPVTLGLYSQGLGDNTQSEAKNIHPSQMFFTYDDIGGLAGIARWIKTSAKFKAVIGSLLSHWYLPTIYTDNRFLNIIIAAEALERIRLNQQNLNFAKGLKRLVNYAGDPIQSMVSDVEGWVNEIVRVRQNNLVHRGLRGDAEGPRMFWLAESLYFLVVFCLLRECGVPEKVLENIKDHQKFRMIAEQLQSTKGNK